MFSLLSVVNVSNDKVRGYSILLKLCLTFGQEGEDLGDGPCFSLRSN